MEWKEVSSKHNTTILKKVAEYATISQQNKVVYLWSDSL